LSFSAEVLATINGQSITTDVAPKNFKTLDSDTQKKIVDRLVEKRLASDYALSTKIVKTDEYKKALEHVLQMSSEKKEKSENLANLFKKDSSIDGYTTEQLNSKKGLLAFDFILNEKAETLKLSDEKLKEYYASRKYKYDTPAMIELLTIVVDDKKLADEIIKKLQKSEDRLEVFSKLAAKHSLAPSAKNHGYFGKIPLNELNDTLKPALKGLNRNDFVKSPIKTDFGYQIFYVLNDIPEYKSTYEGVKSTIEEELLRAEVKNWAMQKIAKLKKEATIKIKI
jgi:foldase protein PrsA